MCNGAVCLYTTLSSQASAIHHCLGIFYTEYASPGETRKVRVKAAHERGFNIDYRMKSGLKVTHAQLNTS